MDEDADVRIERCGQQLAGQRQVRADSEQAGDAAALRRVQIERVQRRQHQRRDRRDPHAAVPETGGQRREHERGDEGRHDRRLLGRGQAEGENRQPRRRPDEDEGGDDRRVDEHFRMRLVDPPEDRSSGEQDGGHRRNPPDEQHRDGGEQQEVQRREAGAGIPADRFGCSDERRRGERVEPRALRVIRRPRRPEMRERGGDLDVIARVADRPRRREHGEAAAEREYCGEHHGAAAARHREHAQQQQHTGGDEHVREHARTRYHSLTEGLRPSDSPARSLARRFAGALRSRGSLAVARSRGRACLGLIRLFLGGFFGRGSEVLGRLGHR